jgi:hypothetical protein
LAEESCPLDLKLFFGEYSLLAQIRQLPYFVSRAEV